MSDEENYRKIHYPVEGKHTLGDALKCQKCGSPIVFVYSYRDYSYGSGIDNKRCLCNDKKNRI